MTKLDELREGVLACTRCPAHTFARAPIPCAFPLAATVAPPVLVVGPYPTHADDYAGAPFTGTPGKKLSEWLENAGLTREVDVVVTNLTKCFTGKVPTQESVGACSLWLSTELGLFQPRLVVSLGGLACKVLSPGRQDLSEMAGQIIESDNPKKASVMYTHHPFTTLLNAKTSNSFWAHSEALRNWLLNQSWFVPLSKQ